MTNKAALQLIRNMRYSLGDIPRELESPSLLDVREALELAIQALEIRAFDDALSEAGLFPVMVTKDQFAKIRELSDKGEL